jgi:dinuclear metal center YbgI/SA1388 family protein
MTVTVQDIIHIVEDFAPPYYAEHWDNVGLQVGHRDQRAALIWVALDPSIHVVTDACEQGVDLLVTHHPLIHHPLKRIDFSSAVGAVVQKAVCHNLSIYSAHTNLDSAAGGVNDVLASTIGLENLQVLGKPIDEDICKLVVFAPPEYEEKLLDAFFLSRAGRIGDYTCCSFRSPGKGTFMPPAAASPFTGRPGQLNHVDEIRIEAIVHKKDLSAVVENIRKIHPYENVACDVYPLLTTGRRLGLGRIGDLKESISLDSFIATVKRQMGLKHVRVAGLNQSSVKRVAVCAGSGSSFLNEFINSDAQVYISGDLKYHDAKTVEEANKALVDVGHFASEHLIIKTLVDKIRVKLTDKGADATVEAYARETDPFVIT